MRGRNRPTDMPRLGETKTEYDRGSGDIAAMNHFADRVDGKVSQPIGGAEDLPPQKVQLDFSRLSDQQLDARGDPARGGQAAGRRRGLPIQPGGARQLRRASSTKRFFRFRGSIVRFEPYSGDDPVSYVVSLNLRRRHLNESQRAMVAAKLATLRDGQRADLVEGLPIGRASELLNVGERSVARAREVIDRGVPELQQAVERGHVSVSAAADVASKPVEEQRQIVARGEREILEAAKAIRAERAEARREERLANLAEISRGNGPRRLPPLYPC